MTLDRHIFEADLRRPERLTLREQRANLAKWLDDLTHEPELVAERVSWLLAGHYGKGAYDAVPHGNPLPWLLETIAALEWSVPRALHRRHVLEIGSDAMGRVRAAIEVAIQETCDEDY